MGYFTNFISQFLATFPNGCSLNSACIVKSDLEEIGGIFHEIALGVHTYKEDFQKIDEALDLLISTSTDIIYTAIRHEAQNILSSFQSEKNHFVKQESPLSPEEYVNKIVRLM